MPSRTFERDGATCVRAGFIGDRDEDEAQMTDALQGWVDAMPGGQAELREVAGHPGLEACDPGEDLDLELTGRSETSLYLPNLWGYLVADATEVLDPDGARCYARAVIADLTYGEIVDPEGTAFDGDAFQAKLDAAFEACS